MACAIAKNTSCLTAAGSESTVAGSSWPPLALMCTPEPAAAASDSVSRRAKTAPNAATPSDPPICWKNIRALLATPMSRCCTLFCAISETICIKKPMPRPRTT